VGQDRLLANAKQPQLDLLGFQLVCSLGSDCLSISSLAEMPACGPVSGICSLHVTSGELVMHCVNIRRV